MATTTLTPTARRSTLGYMPALDGLRALAVVGVMLFHAVANVMPGGFLGVSSFFTLSGFLITTLLLDELTGTGHIHIGRFWARRVKRLAPAALTVTAAAILFTRTPWAGWGHGMQASDGVAGAVNVMNWHVMTLADQPYRVLGPLGPYWSLGVEEQFYAVMAIGFLMLRRSPTTASRRLGRTAVGVWIGSAAIAVLMHSDHPREMFGTDVRAAELAAGALLAVAVQRVGVTWFSSDERRGRRLNAAGWAGVVLTVGLFVFATLNQPWVRAGGFAALSIVHVAVISGAMSGRSLARVLAWRPFVEVGKLSYSLYLVHWPVMLSLRGDRLNLGTAPLAVVRLSASVAVAVVVHVLVERPVRRHWGAAPRPTIIAWIGATLAVSALALVAL